MILSNFDHTARNNVESLKKLVVIGTLKRKQSNRWSNEIKWTDGFIQNFCFNLANRTGWIDG